MIRITFEKYKVELVFTQYENGNTAILFVGAKGTPYQGEPICKATVNGYTTLNDPDICGFKSWNEGPSVIETLVKHHIIEPAPIFQEPAGFGFIEYHELTPLGKDLRASRG